MKHGTWHVEPALGSRREDSDAAGRLCRLALADLSAQSDFSDAVVITDLGLYICRLRVGCRNDDDDPGFTATIAPG